MEEDFDLCYHDFISCLVSLLKCKLKSSSIIVCFLKAHDYFIFCFNGCVLCLKELKGERYRLRVVVRELSETIAVDYQKALVAFINCVIISTQQIKDRIKIRNEFIGKKTFIYIDRLL